MYKFNRILLKLSGEGLSHSSSSLLDYNKVSNLSVQLKELQSHGIEVAIVIGGGNICRGGAVPEAEQFSRNTLDNIGMLSTLINGLLLSDALENHGIENVLMSSLEVNKVADFYNVYKAKDVLKSKKVLILVGGIACSLFSTDTAAVVRGSELQCNAVLKATKVDGLFDKDPTSHPDANLIKQISYEDFIANKFKVMDLSSIVVAQMAGLPICIFNMNEPRAVIELCSKETKVKHSLITFSNQ